MNIIFVRFFMFFTYWQNIPKIGNNWIQVNMLYTQFSFYLFVLWMQIKIFPYKFDRLFSLSIAPPYSSSFQRFKFGILHPPAAHKLKIIFNKFDSLLVNYVIELKLNLYYEWFSFSDTFSILFLSFRNWIYNIYFSSSNSVGTVSKDNMKNNNALY